MKERVFGYCTVTNKDIDPKTGKPCLRIEWPDGTVIYITTNVAEMIGGLGAGTRTAWQEKHNAQR